MTEEWRSPAGELSEYIQVSDMGRMRYVRTGRTYEAAEKIKEYARFAYKGRRYKLHRIIALTFLDNPDNLPTVNHKNGKKWDNRAVNLEWASFSENNKHAYAENLKSFDFSKHGKLKESDIIDIRRKCKEGRRTVSLAKEYNVTRRCISDIKHKHSWKHVA